MFACRETAEQQSESPSNQFSFTNLSKSAFLFSSAFEQFVSESPENFANVESAGSFLISQAFFSAIKQYLQVAHFKNFVMVIRIGSQFSVSPIRNSCDRKVVIFVYYLYAIVNLSL